MCKKCKFCTLMTIVTEEGSEIIIDCGRKDCDNHINTDSVIVDLQEQIPP